MSMVHCEECDREISSLAEFCPHCGRPTSVKKSIRYSLRLGRKYHSTFASYLKGLAILVAIGGIILSILAANVTTNGYYRSETTFSISIFLSNLWQYAEAVFVLWSLGVVVELIQETHDMVEGMTLNQIENSGDTSPTPTASAAPRYVPSNDATTSGWRCKKCEMQNATTDMYCKGCGAYR